jgi:hypothetical protein
MSWTVDRSIKVGDFTFAAIVETRIASRCTGRTMIAHGEKRPVLLLVMEGAAVRGIDMAGRACDADQIARLYPQAIEQMRAQLAAISKS